MLWALLDFILSRCKLGRKGKMMTGVRCVLVGIGSVLVGLGLGEVAIALGAQFAMAHAILALCTAVGVGTILRARQ